MKDTQDIMKKLEDGVKSVFESDRYREYLEAMGRFHNYSFGNCVLIAMQKPEATMVAGFNTWKNKFSRTVKKGEKGIQILAPCPHKKKVENILADGTVEEKEVTFTTYRAAYVFDVSQTEGKEIPSIVTRLSGEVEDYEKVFNALVKIAPVKRVEFEDIQGGANGYFNSAENRIAIRNGMSEAQTIKTLVHEIAHSILHDKDSGEQKEATRRAKEVQAESVSYAACNYIGIDASEYTFGYVAGWSSGKEYKELKESLEVIHRTATDIMCKLEGLAA